MTCFALPPIKFKTVMYYSSVSRYRLRGRLRLTGRSLPRPTLMGRSLPRPGSRAKAKKGI